MKKSVFVALSVAVLVAACGPRGEVAVPRPPDRSTVTLPAPVPIADGLRIELRRPATPRQLRALEKMAGVNIVSAVGIRRFDVAAGTRALPLRVAIVDPISFRSFAPASTRDADFVWTSLVGSRAVLTPGATDRLRFKEPGSLTIRKRKFDVGAFADNGTPNFADVVLSRRAFGAMGATMIFVGTRDASKLDGIRRKLRSELHGIRRIGRLVPQPAEAVAAAPAQPVGVVEGDLIGAMTFRILKSGYIEPDPAWVAANIASGEVPILGRVTCHRLLFPQLAAALAEIQQEGLASRLHRSDYGGCYVPRFIGRDPRRGLSMHAFGLALDLNVSENYLGTRGNMDPRIVEIFEKWGFRWGGRWSQPDPMHFELSRLVEPS